MSDLLRDAAGALRDAGGEPGDRAAATRARVMMSLHARKRRRATLTSLLVPVFALLVGSSAWAAATGSMPRVWRAVGEVFGGASPPNEPPSQDLPKRAAHTRFRSDLSALRAGASQGDREEPAPEPSTAAKPRAGKSRSPKPVLALRSSEPVAEPPPAVDPTLDLYRTAHHAHFVDQDWPRALAAWNTYLQDAPKGRFVPEARYNRALALIRMARYAEARRALEPFAGGSLGGYRQREAKALLEELGEEE